MNASWYAMRFQSNTATFEEMKSSGKFDLIKDIILEIALLCFIETLIIVRIYLKVTMNF